MAEQDPECRRLNATRWPGCDLVVDTKRVTKRDVEKWMHSVPGLTGVIAGLRLSLFFDFVQVLGWIEELGEELQVWTARVLENVIGDDEDISEMIE